jgi:hypothetical protein
MPELVLEEMKKNKTEELNSPDLLDQLTVSIVYQLKSVGVFRYNKLTYLFEYLFIKNFGKRFTGHQFCKLPHGPVIQDYKAQIRKLHNSNVVNTDMAALMTKRPLEDDIYHALLPIYSTNQTENFLIKNPMVMDFLKKVLDKYALLSDVEIERVVYRTQPVVKYLELVKDGFKREIGGRVLDNNVKIRSNNPVTKARQKVLKHLEKFPTINATQHLKYAEEVAYLNNLRPEWPDYR